MSGEPKFYQRESDGRWVILDRPVTPFWWASFGSKRDAAWAWDVYQKNLIDAAIHAEHCPDI